MDTKRHAPVGRRRVQLGLSHPRSRTYTYTGRSRRPLGDIYVSDHAETRQSGRFRWVLSTCLAAAVGVLAILVVIAGSSDTQETAGGMLSSLQRARDAPLATFRLPSARVDGLRWAIPKTDRLRIPGGAMATKFVIFDAVRQRRGNRDYILNKPYARLVARLAPVPKSEVQRIPPLNPFKLYANTTPLDAAEPLEDGQQDAAVRIVELLGGVIPSEDGQELGADEVADLRAPRTGCRRGAGPAAAGLCRGCAGGRRWRSGRTHQLVSEPLPPGTSLLPRRCSRRRTPAMTWRAARSA